LAIKVRELKTRLKDGLSEREFLYFPPERSKFYKEPMLFGKRRVNDRVFFCKAGRQQRLEMLRCAPYSPRCQPMLGGAAKDRTAIAVR